MKKSTKCLRECVGGEGVFFHIKRLLFILFPLLYPRCKSLIHVIGCPWRFPYVCWFLWCLIFNDILVNYLFFDPTHVFPCKWHQVFTMVSLCVNFCGVAISFSLQEFSVMLGMFVVFFCKILVYFWWLNISLLFLITKHYNHTTI